VEVSDPVLLRIGLNDAVKVQELPVTRVLVQVPFDAEKSTAFNPEIEIVIPVTVTPVLFVNTKDAGLSPLGTGLPAGVGKNV